MLPGRPHEHVLRDMTGTFGLAQGMEDETLPSSMAAEAWQKGHH